MCGNGRTGRASGHRRAALAREACPRAAGGQAPVARQLLVCSALSGGAEVAADGRWGAWWAVTPGGRGGAPGVCGRVSASVWGRWRRAFAGQGGAWAGHVAAGASVCLARAV